MKEKKHFLCLSQEKKPLKSLFLVPESIAGQNEGKRANNNSSSERRGRRQRATLQDFWLRQKILRAKGESCKKVCSLGASVEKPTSWRKREEKQQDTKKPLAL